MILEGGGGSDTCGVKFVMGIPNFLDDSGGILLGFEFEVKGNTKVGETVEIMDSLRIT